MKYQISLLCFFLLLPAVVSAQFLFKDITSQSGLYMRSSGASDAGPGVVVFDLNGDGWDDLYLAGGFDSDKLFLNMHDGTFKNIAPPNMLTHIGTSGQSWHQFPRGGIAFDYDNDGYPDIYSVCENNDILWHNNGDGTFTNVMNSAHLDSALDQNESMSATFGDFDGDGYNDFYVARWVEQFPTMIDSFKQTIEKGFPNWFYVNNHDGTFTERAVEFGIESDTATTNIALFFDYDRDGDLDLLVGNDNGLQGRPNRVFKNMLMETGHATFEDVSQSSGLGCHLLCMGIGALDFNKDGNFDFYETSFGPDSLMRNNGDGTFTNVSKKYLPPGNGYESGSSKYVTTNWTVLPGDFDNDGWEDVFVVHGQLGSRFTFTSTFSTNPNNLDTSVFYHNYGGYFENQTLEAISGTCIDLKARGAAYLDLNNDGKLDICVGSLTRDLGNITPDFRLLKNITPDVPEKPAHWLEMRFTAKRTAKEAIGTIVDVYNPDGRHTRQVSTGGGFGSQNSLMQHVGLGQYNYADSIVVSWPADKHRHRQVDRYYNVKGDTILNITENMTEGVTAVPTASQVAVYPNPASKVLNIQTAQDQGKHFEIYDLLGIKHVDVTGSDRVFSVSVNSLKSGCYVLRITTGGNTVTKEFIKE
jgi:hypothetical protein